ncbi:hypothetical protein ONZ45_g9692 [Pleurotus djamor]|nr:hypothetical protein ONZ45_g9692 [Pleurotus djamor]
MKNAMKSSMQNEGRQSESIPIRTESLQQLRDELDFGQFVGSPEAMRPGRMPESSSSPLRRPPIGQRSPSSPYASFATASRSFTHTPRNHDHAATEDGRVKSRQWSLFEQLMENEGLNSPSQPTRGRSHSTATSRFSTISASSSSTPSLTDPFSVNNASLVDEDATPTIHQRHMPPRPPPVEENIDSDYESEDTATPSSSSPTLTEIKKDTVPWYSLRRLPTMPLLYRNILKCAIAYFIGSLFTYNAFLAGFISDMTTYRSGERKPVPSGHMVATISVYFNPAKTIGAMFEADMFCFFGIMYAAFVCLMSMSTFWWLELTPGWEWLGDVMVILWIGFHPLSKFALREIPSSTQASSSGLIPSRLLSHRIRDVACSMIAISLFAVIVKEGGLQTLLQVSFIILCGSTVSNLVCYVIFPQTATSNLQTNMIKTLDSFSTLLNMLTNAFLLEDGLHHPSQGKLQDAVQAHQGSFTSLKKDMKEAKSEWLYGGPGSRARDEPEAAEPLMRPPAPGNGDHQNGNGVSFRQDGKGAGASLRAYEDAVDSLTRLAQHLNGLRSGTRLQYELTKAGLVRSKSKGKGKRGAEGSINVETEGEGEDDALLKAAATMFGDLVDDLGPPLKALSTTCSRSLKSLRDSFAQSRTHRETKRRRQIHVVQPQDFIELVEGIEKALVRFESTSNHAVLRLYRKSNIISATNTHQSLATGFGSQATSSGRDLQASSYSLRSDAQNDREGNIFTQGDNEHVFLVYFFIFTLQEFARELVSLVDAMERIYSLEQERVHRGTWFTRIFSALWTSIKQPFLKNKHYRRLPAESPGLRRTISNILPNVRSRRRTHPSFPKVTPHAPNTMQTPPRTGLSLWGKIGQLVWAVGHRLQERDAKYAIKAGMATALLAAPAFFDATRDIFIDWWGDWALISFFVVLSPTIGATNFLGLHRVVGTITGASIAAVIYTLFPDNNIVLPIFGFFFSLPCFYYIVAKPQYASSSRFVLLTYNLTCLYCYNLREKDVSAVYVAYHRAVAVCFGVLWAAFVSRVWWPAEARRELGKALGEFCLNMGWLYTRLVASNSFSPDTQDDTDPMHVAEGSEHLLSPSPAARELSLLAPRESLSNSIREFMAMELHLQIKLIELQGLLAQTAHEPRLKGPFPIQLYRGILTSLQTILDRFHTFRLKAPLPPYLPPAEKARQRLVDAIRNLDVVRTRDVKGSRHLLFFAYALNLKGVTEELESLGRTLQTAFGVIGQTPEEFEALFESDTSEGREKIEQAA